MIIFDKTLTIMAKQLFSFILLYFFAFSFSQNVDIPDAEFKFFLINTSPEKYQAIDLAGNYTKIDLNGDGEIQITEAQNIKSLYCNNLLVKNILGLEAFKNLDSFSITSNVMLSLDLSLVKNLRSINITNCLSLSFLNLKNLDNLQKVDINGDYNSYLKAIDFSDNINLKTIYWNGKLNAIDISKNTALEDVFLSSQDLSILDISKNTRLKKLTIFKNNINAIDFSSNTEIETLYLSEIKMMDANFSNNSKLKDLKIYGGSLTSIKLPEISYLEKIDLSGCKISNLDLSKQFSLIEMRLNENLLENLDFSNNKNLKFLMIFKQPSVKSLDIRLNPNLEIFWFDYLDNLESLYIKNNKKQNFSESYNSCPKLNFVCCDEDEKSFFINKGVPNVTADCLLATQENNFISNVKIHPNPASDYLSFNQNIEAVKVFDFQGKLVLNQKINSNNINISALKAGVYVVEMYSNNKKANQKFIKK